MLYFLISSDLATVNYLEDKRIATDLFVPRVTQGNEDTGCVQDFVFWFLVLIKGIRRQDFLRKSPGFLT